MVFTASLLGAQHIRDGVENKAESLLVVSLGKALNRMPTSLCGRQMVGPSSLPAVVAQFDERHANRALAHTCEGMNHAFDILKNRQKVRSKNIWILQAMFTSTQVIALLLKSSIRNTNVKIKHKYSHTLFDVSTSRTAHIHLETITCTNIKLTRYS